MLYKVQPSHVDEVYAQIVQTVLTTGARKENRTGVDTISTFNINYELDLKHGFPLLTTKQISWKNIVIELLWFMTGRTDLAFLRKHGCKFWDAWEDEKRPGYIAEGSYGEPWRAFGERKPGHASHYNPNGFDQLAWVINELKRNPNSRRLIVSAWDAELATKSKLPPCHAFWVLNVQEGRLCLHLTQRSCDVALGLPYNIASYALLIHLLAKMSGLEPGIFGHTLVDAHIYTSKPDGSMAEFNHVPGLMQQIQRVPLDLPTFRFGADELGQERSFEDLGDIEWLAEQETGTILKTLCLENYSNWGPIPFKAAV